MAFDRQEKQAAVPGHAVARGLRRFVLLCAVLATGGALAQLPPGADAASRQADTLQRLEQERLRQDIERAQAPERPHQGIDTEKLVPRPDLSGVSKTCRVIREIAISGAPRLPASVRERIQARFVDRCLGVAEIEEILGEITRAYVVDGYVTTRAYLPAQDLSTGRLEITVIEGRVGSLRIEDGGKNSVSKGNAFPLVEGRVLNLRDLEQGIDQINRLASNSAQLDIQPGESPGESVIVIRNAPRAPYHANVSYDNQGAENTGKKQAGVLLSYDNPLGFNDFLSLTWRESMPHDRDKQFSGSKSVNYSLPFGYSTLSLSASQSDYANTVVLPSGLHLYASGKTITQSARLDRVLYRDQASKFGLAAMLTRKSSKNYLNDQYLAVSSRDLTLIDIDGSASLAVAGASLQAEAGLSQGLDMMGAMQDMAGLPDSAPRAQFRKYKASLNYFLPFSVFGLDASFSSQLVGQHARDVLYGSEQISIGSLYSVRGFVNNTLAGDNGYYWRNELSMRVPLKLGEQTVSGRAFVALDQGKVTSRAAGSAEGRLVGSALGIALAWQGASWEWSVTRPISAPGFMSLESAQAWFRVSFSL